jgi:hypothetical protein
LLGPTCNNSTKKALAAPRHELRRAGERVDERTGGGSSSAGPYDRGELLFQGFDPSRQLDRGEQLGAWRQWLRRGSLRRASQVAMTGDAGMSFASFPKFWAVAARRNSSV